MWRKHLVWDPQIETWSSVHVRGLLHLEMHPLLILVSYFYPFYPLCLDRPMPQMQHELVDIRECMTDASFYAESNYVLVCIYQSTPHESWHELHIPSSDFRLFVQVTVVDSKCYFYCDFCEWLLTQWPMQQLRPQDMLTTCSASSADSSSRCSS